LGADESVKLTLNTNMFQLLAAIELFLQHEATTTLASHPCRYHFQNTHPYVSYPLWNLSIINGIHGYVMWCFQF